jgi:hypothetical protein
MNLCHSPAALKSVSGTVGSPNIFYFDDIPARRLRPDILTSEQAPEQANALARAERDNG